MSDITIITVNYNAHDSIKKAIELYIEKIRSKEIRYIIVDNSNDKVLEELIKKQYPEVKYIRSPGNIGYGRGCNIGLGYVDTPYCLLLNPDALLQVSDLEKMHSFMQENPSVAFLGPCIHEPDGSFQSAGGLPTPNDIIKVATGIGIPYFSKREIQPGDAPFKTDWLCAAIVLTRMKALNDIGYFDPRFFLYFEETDLCRRLLSSGWEIWATGEAEGFHQNAGSASLTRELMYNSCIAKHYFQSRFYYMSKHYGLTKAITAEVVEYLITPLRLLLQILKGNKDSNKYLIRLRSPLLSFPKRMHNEN